MNFSEARFWELLAMALSVILLVRMVITRFRTDLERYDKGALCLLGIFLLGCVSTLTLSIFLIVGIGTYVGLAWIVSKPVDRRFKYLFVLIPLQLLPLVYFKYAHFLVTEAMGLQMATLRDLAIPVGISFYTFQKVAFVVDTLHFHKPLPKFLDYLNFASFFPQIVAGPIERRENLLPQMEKFRFRWLPEHIDQGAGWIVLGLFFKCCLADNLAVYFNPASETNAYLIWIANLFFGLRIYYDFAGYSFVALGIARCLGIRLTLNFASPYCGTSATDFWRRWHITLSQWFRDYLYIPLGGSRVRWWAFNILLVFTISGVWHGAGWNFLWWGVMHGVFLITHRVLGSRLSIPRFFGWIVTVVAVYAAWLCFYELRSDVLRTKFLTLMSPSAYSLVAFQEALSSWSEQDMLIVGTTLSLSGIAFLLEWRSLKRGEPYLLLRKPAVLFVLIVLTMLLSPIRQNDFIYFAF